MPGAPLHRSALGIGGWVAAGRIAPQASGLVLLVMGGRYLAPETLGSFILAFAGIEFLRLLVRAGWREATLMDDTGIATPTVLALAIAAGVAAQPIALAAALAAPRLSTAADLAPSLALLGVSLLPVGAAAVWEGVLIRRGAPERAARPLIAAEMAQTAVAALLLVSGWGILALAIARALRAAVLALGLAAAAGWPCAVSLDLGRARAVLPIAGHVTLAGLAGFAGSSGADLVVGIVLGPAAVAVYRIAARIAGAAAEVVTETIRVLTWSALAGRDPRTASTVTEIFDCAFVLTTPVFLGLALVAGALVETVLGPAWSDAAPVLVILALARLSAVPATLAPPILASHGRAQALPRFAAFLAVTGLLSTLVAGRFGVTAVATAQLATGVLGAAVALALLRQIEPAATLLPGPLLIAAAAGFALVVAAAGLGSGPAPATLAIQIATGAALWATFLRVGRPALAADLLRSARSPDA